MKYLRSVLIAIFFWMESAPYLAQNAIDEPIRWDRYPYRINSSYPYLNELPNWSKIPELIEWISRETNDAGGNVAYSQLVALSRSDFKHPLRPPAGGMPKESIDYYRSERIQAWEQWWKSVGQSYGERLSATGRQNTNAWKLVVRDKRQPTPNYKVAIPDEWTLRTAYRAGDYDGVQTESLTLHRTKEKATLIRALRKSTRGPLEWERWEPLTTLEADDFAFAIAYAIDNPWLLKPNHDDNSSRKLEGRNLTLYYPDFRYEFADGAGNIWWNDDPWNWHGGGHGRDNSMDVGLVLGSVCVLVCRTFPDNALTNTALPKGGKWSPVKMPDAVVLQSVAEDLALRGEIIDALSNSQRMSDALETLAEFGVSAELPAITQLEAELPVRVEKVKSILEQDPNGGFVRLNVERLLTAAAKAKTAIQHRSAGAR